MSEINVEVVSNTTTNDVISNIEPVIVPPVVEGPKVNLKRVPRVIAKRMTKKDKTRYTSIKYEFPCVAAINDCYKAKELDLDVTRSVFVAKDGKERITYGLKVRVV